MSVSATPFLMFEGRCEEALAFYVAGVPGTRVEAIEHWGPGQPAEGKVRLARATIAGMAVFANDSPVHHGFTFTPSISFMLEVADEAELDRLVDALGAGGPFLMPPGNYGFSRKFAWFNDRFGVSWEVNCV